jgi:hypothetical protein
LNPREIGEFAEARPVQLWTVMHENEQYFAIGSN